MGQPTLEVQVKNQRAEVRRLKNPQTLVEAEARLAELEVRLAKRQRADARAAAREDVGGSAVTMTTEQLREAQVSAVLEVMKPATLPPRSREILRRRLVEQFGMTEAEALQRVPSAEQ